MTQARWNRQDIIHAYALLAWRGPERRRSGRDTYEQLRRMGFSPTGYESSDLTANGLAIYGAAHLRELGDYASCPICDEHTLRFECPFRQ
jgi:hypothetical protein